MSVSEEPLRSSKLRACNSEEALENLNQKTCLVRKKFCDFWPKASELAAPNSGPPGGPNYRHQQARRSQIWVRLADPNLGPRFYRHSPDFKRNQAWKSVPNLGPPGGPDEGRVCTRHLQEFQEKPSLPMRPSQAEPPDEATASGRGHAA